MAELIQMKNECELTFEFYDVFFIHQYEIQYIKYCKVLRNALLNTNNQIKTFTKLSESNNI